MAITFPLLTGFSESFPSGSMAATKNVGTGSNRYAVAFGYLSADSARAPTTFSVGSDTLTLSGSTYTNAYGMKSRAWVGALDDGNTGSVTCSMGLDGAVSTGGAVAALMVIQGGSALTVDGVLSLLFSEFGGGGGTVTRSVTTTTGDLAVVLCAEISSVAASAGSGLTLITSDTAYIDAGHATAAGASTDAIITYAAFGAPYSIAFAVRESGGGGSSAGAAAHYYRQLQG